MTRWFLCAAVLAALVLPGCSGTPSSSTVYPTRRDMFSPTGKATDADKSSQKDTRDKHDPG
jgi:hypothetical protein